MVLNIAMDGPVGAGKSSIARAVADRLGILHLDTGAMYRAVGLSAIRAGVDLQDEAAVTAHTKAIDVSVAHAEGGQRTIVNGEDLTDFIRTPEVSMAASTVGKYAGVRREMVAIQQKLAASTPMLVDGRDICVRVLPNATVKLFLTASAEERARRRWLEMTAKGDTTPLPLYSRLTMMTPLDIGSIPQIHSKQPQEVIGSSRIEYKVTDSTAPWVAS